jgi:hypothetical protein
MRIRRRSSITGSKFGLVALVIIALVYPIRSSISPLCTGTHILPE